MLLYYLGKLEILFSLFFFQVQKNNFIVKNRF